MAAMSFTPDELFTAVKKHVPHLQISYKVDARQKIGMHRVKLSIIFIWIFYIESRFFMSNFMFKFIYYIKPTTGPKYLMIHWRVKIGVGVMIME